MRIALLVSSVIAVGVSAAETSAAVDTLTKTGSSSYSIFDDVKLQGNGSASDIFQRSFNMDRFDPTLGTLTAVLIKWELVGEVRIGVSPRGPSFFGGSGMVEGIAALELFGETPNINPLLESQTLTGSHVGSIAGPPGSDSSDTLDLEFHRIGQVAYSDPQDVTFFVGSEPLRFNSTLNLHTIVTVSQFGPNFGISVGVPLVKARVTTIYHYVPEPAGWLICACGLPSVLGIRFSRRVRSDLSRPGSHSF